MSTHSTGAEPFDSSSFHFYRRAMELVEGCGVPYLVGGAFALGFYTGITRHTKDLDLFVRPGDILRALDALSAGGYRTELVFPHWLGKVFHGDDFVDLIFNSGNGLCPPDDAWFDHAVAGELLGRSVRYVPVEEMIWQKAYIMERERFDGADVMHLLRGRGQTLDWQRLRQRFGPHWRVMLSHIVLFGFVYPGERESIPGQLLRDLSNLADESREAKDPGVCQGTLLSRLQYLTDIEEWGYADPRLAPAGPLTREQIIYWTDAGR